MDDFDDWQFERDFHIAMGGSITVAFARQIIYDRVEHFDATIAALEALGKHSHLRPVILTFELEAYFLSIFACLEQIIISACGDVEKVARLAISFQDIRGTSVFDRAVKYLRMVESVQMDRKVLVRLGKYQIVRNAIAHGIGTGGIRGKKLETVLQLPGIEYDAESEIAEVSKQFCARFNDFAYEYVDQIERVVSTFGSRAKQKVTSAT